MRVAIVENTRITHHGQVGVALHEAAAKIDLYKPWSDRRLPDPDSFDALVVFGGEQSARDDHSHPYLPDLARLMSAAGAEGKAVLGICLGSQLLARGLGADNHLGTAREFGWCDVTLTDEGRNDPVLGQLPATFPIFQWHSDTFTLPAGTAHLAGSGVAQNQCFRLNRATYGMQFHFEASRAVVADWNRSFPEAVERNLPGWLDTHHPERAPVQGAQADAAGLAIARAWVGLIESAT
ncbi:MAG: type 1 glutamine amidotransferase [Rhodobacteraceae bacterium]|nr:type 1 glutamine amidotransferase [Paracoccaceae bacterium]